MAIRYTEELRYDAVPIAITGGLLSDVGCRLGGQLGHHFSYRTYHAGYVTAPLLPRLMRLDCPLLGPSAPNSMAAIRPAC